MKYEVLTETDGNKANGTSLRGEIDAAFAELVMLFGEPLAGCDKSDAEWLLEFEDGTIATIYNWKDGHNYCGADGMPVDLITDWHIGGFDSNAYMHVLEVIEEYRKG